MGGVVQGIGQCLMEVAHYASDGQLVSGSFMDYAMPRAGDAPRFAYASLSDPAKTNPLGVKGCGEAGCAGSMTSVMNAVVDALSVYGVRHIDMPATPNRVWDAIRRHASRPPSNLVSPAGRREDVERIAAYGERRRGRARRDFTVGVDRPRAPRVNDEALARISAHVLPRPMRPCAEMERHERKTPERAHLEAVKIKPAVADSAVLVNTHAAAVVPAVAYGDLECPNPHVAMRALDRRAEAPCAHQGAGPATT